MKEARRANKRGTMVGMEHVSHRVLAPLFFQTFVSLFKEGLSNPQQASSGGLLHDAVVVAGVHRKRAVGIKDTHTKTNACRVQRLCSGLRTPASRLT